MKERDISIKGLPVVVLVSRQCIPSHHRERESKLERLRGIRFVSQAEVNIPIHKL